MENSIKIPILCGPTGSGKTSVALEIATKLPIEIISADSRQMIKHLDIGTAKPTQEEQKQVRFHLVDIIEPGKDYSAFKFIEDTDKAIKQIISNGHIPVIVGGTGLYLKALTDGIFDIESDNSKVRIEIEKELEELGVEKMYNKLKEVDPEEAARFHPNNKVRIIRALEIFRLTGKPKSELAKSASYKKSRHQFHFYCLNPSREKLYQSIENRVDKMMEAGLLDELKGLIERGMAASVQKMNVIGYDELLNHINGNSSLEDAVLLIKQNSRRYAKRQVTWFRHQIDCENFSTSKDLLEAFYGHYATFAQGGT